jgi:hypothetical protein
LRYPCRSFWAKSAPCLTEAAYAVALCHVSVRGGTWYGPDEGPDTRRSGAAGYTAAAAASGLAAQQGEGFGATQNGYSLRGYGSEAEAGDPHRIDSGSGVFTDVDLGLGTAGYLLGVGGLDAGSEDPDIDDLLLSDPRDGSTDPRVGNAVAAGAAAAKAGRPPPSVASAGSSWATRSSSAPTWKLQVCIGRPRPPTLAWASGPMPIQTHTADRLWRVTQRVRVQLVLFPPFCTANAARVLVLLRVS